MHEILMYRLQGKCIIYEWNRAIDKNGGPQSGNDTVLRGEGGLTTKCYRTALNSV